MSFIANRSTTKKLRVKAKYGKFIVALRETQGINMSVWHIYDKYVLNFITLSLKHCDQDIKVGITMHVATTVLLCDNVD